MFVYVSRNGLSNQLQEQVAQLGERGDRFMRHGVMRPHGKTPR